MSVNPLSSGLQSLLETEPLASSSASSVGLNSGVQSFADVFSAAFDNVEATDAADKSSTLALLSGQTDDLAGLMLDTQKAEIALSLALSMRSKVLDAYTEIMNMQIYRGGHLPHLFERGFCGAPCLCRFFAFGFRCARRTKRRRR